MVIRVPSGITDGSTATMPGPTEIPVAVVPVSAYAVATTVICVPEAAGAAGAAADSGAATGAGAGALAASAAASAACSSAATACSSSDEISDSVIWRSAASCSMYADRSTRACSSDAAAASASA